MRAVVADRSAPADKRLTASFAPGSIPDRARMMRRVCSLASFSARSWPCGRGEEQALPPVGGAGAALDEVLLDQLLEDPVQALLGDPQDVEQFGDGEARLAVDEMQHPVMGPPETVNRPGSGRDR